MTDNFFVQTLTSPIGEIHVYADSEAVKKIRLNSSEKIVQNPNQITALACRELEEYFNGKRKIFTVKLSPEGTQFQRKVWDKLLNIEYGKTASYKDIAQAVDSPKASRAVGNANHNNPVPIIIPCHRVISANGNQGGFALGGNVKTYLLNLEKQNI